MAATLAGQGTANAAHASRTPPLPFDEADFEDHEDFLRAVYEAGISPLDGQGRPRFVYSGPGYYARLLQGIYGPPPASRPKRRSEGLTKREFLNAYAGVAYANYGGVVLNTFTSITWPLQGLRDDHAIRKANKSFIENFRHWIRNNGAPHAVVWVMERGGRRGVHSHFLSFVPEPAYHRYTAWARKSVAKITQAPLMKRDSTTGQREATFHSSLLEPRKWQTDVDVQWTVFRYLIKGVLAEELAKVLANQNCARAVKAFAKESIGAEGLIAGKRSGVSRSIDKKARGDFDQIYGLGVPAEAGMDTLAFDNGFIVAGEVARAIPNLDV